MRVLNVKLFSLNFTWFAYTLHVEILNVQDKCDKNIHLSVCFNKTTPKIFVVLKVNNNNNKVNYFIDFVLVWLCRIEN